MDSQVAIKAVSKIGISFQLFVKATRDDNVTSVGEWMNTAGVAGSMKLILDLPKNLGISEVVLYRKQAK